MQQRNQPPSSVSASEMENHLRNDFQFYGAAIHALSVLVAFTMGKDNRNVVVRLPMPTLDNTPHLSVSAPKYTSTVGLDHRPLGIYT